MGKREGRGSSRIEVKEPTNRRRLFSYEKKGKGEHKTFQRSDSIKRGGRHPREAPRHVEQLYFCLDQGEGRKEPLLFNEFLQGEGEGEANGLQVLGPKGKEEKQRLQSEKRGGKNDT